MLPSTCKERLERKQRATITLNDEKKGEARECWRGGKQLRNAGPPQNIIPDDVLLHVSSN